MATKRSKILSTAMGGNPLTGSLAGRVAEHIPVVRTVKKATDRLLKEKIEDPVAHYAKRTVAPAVKKGYGKLERYAEGKPPVSVVKQDKVIGGRAKKKTATNRSKPIQVRAGIPSAINDYASEGDVNTALLTPNDKRVNTVQMKKDMKPNVNMRNGVDFSKGPPAPIVSGTVVDYGNMRKNFARVGKGDNVDFLSPPLPETRDINKFVPMTPEQFRKKWGKGSLIEDQPATFRQYGVSPVPRVDNGDGTTSAGDSMAMRSPAAMAMRARMNLQGSGELYGSNTNRERQIRQAQLDGRWQKAYDSAERSALPTKEAQDAYDTKKRKDALYAPINEMTREKQKHELDMANVQAGIDAKKQKQEEDRYNQKREDERIAGINKRIFDFKKLNTDEGDAEAAMLQKQLDAGNEQAIAKPVMGPKNQAIIDYAKANLKTSAERKAYFLANADDEEFKKMNGGASFTTM